MFSLEKINDIKSKAFMGYPVQLDNICQIYPLTVSEVVEMGLLTYNKFLGLLLLTPEKIQEIVSEKSDQKIVTENFSVFSYLLQSADHDDTFLLELQNAFSTFLKEEVLLLPTINAVLVGNPAEKRLIKEPQFLELQDTLRIQNRNKVEVEIPKNETYGERKMRLLREKVAKVKAKQNKKNQKDELSFSDLLEIATIYNIDIKNCTIFAFYGLLRRNQAKEKYESDIRALCAGADSSKIDVKYWGETLKED